MEITLEKHLWKFISDIRPAEYVFERFEPTGINPGVSDVRWKSQKFKARGWIELKVVANENSTIKFEEHQPEWIREEYLCGACVLIAVYLKRENEVRFYTASKIEFLENGPLSSLESYGDLKLVRSDYSSMSCLLHSYLITEYNRVLNRSISKRERWI